MTNLTSGRMRNARIESLMILGEANGILKQQSDGLGVAPCQTILRARHRLLLRQLAGHGDPE